MLDRFQGGRLVELPDGIEVPRGPRVQSGRLSLRSFGSSSGATVESLRSAISRCAVCLVHLLESARSFTSSCGGQLREVDRLLEWSRRLRRGP